jgi:hypothetical protein
MAKKKSKLIDLKNKNLSFELNGLTYKLINFKVDSQKLDIEIFENNKFLKNDVIAFARIPKSLKRLVKPLF